MHLELANIHEFEKKPLVLPDAPFLNYKPDLNKIRHAWNEYGYFQNILVIGHGGSISSFVAMHETLRSNKEVFILNSTDPEYIAELRKKLPIHQTLVIAISKSGETITQIEALLHFIDYPLLFIAGRGSSLEQIGKRLKAKIIEHPEIGGRYTAFTEVALVPAAISGLDVQKIYEGGKRFHELYHQDNIALKAAQIFFELEQKGLVDVFMPFYGHNLFPLSDLAIQLVHESFGKAGVGQTYFASEAPEAQHHTIQRFFGGRKNIAGFFWVLDHFRNDTATIVPPGIQNVPIKDDSLFALNKMPLSYSMHSEFKGTWEDAKIRAIPSVALHLSAIEPEEIGASIAFWQMFGVYSSVFRGVDPFDQPEVENSKNISWMKRKGYRTQYG